MAERIDNLTPLRGRPAIYPWERWMDGSSWRIHQGHDFKVSARSMAQSIRERGRRDGVKVHARQLGGEVVEFRFGPPPETPEQRHHRELHDGTLTVVPPGGDPRDGREEQAA